MRKKRIVTTVLILLLAVSIFQILFDPLSSFMHFSESLQARIVLPHARQKWESHEITHYKFDIRGGASLVCIFGGNIEVKDGKVVHTGPRSDAGTEQNPFLDAGFSNSEYLPAICNYKNYTMPLFFDELERWLHNSPFSINQISFDPEYGFVSHFGFGNCGGRGLLNPIVSDCAGGFSIENFQVLDE